MDRRNHFHTWEFQMHLSMLIPPVFDRPIPLHISPATNGIYSYYWCNQRTSSLLEHESMISCHASPVADLKKGRIL